MINFLVVMSLFVQNTNFFLTLEVPDLIFKGSKRPKINILISCATFFICNSFFINKKHNNHQKMYISCILTKFDQSFGFFIIKSYFRIPLKKPCDWH